MKKKTKQTQPKMSQKQADLVREVIQEFGHTPEALFGPDGLIKHMTKRFVEQALDAEMEEHVGYPPHASLLSKKSTYTLNFTPSNLPQKHEKNRPMF